MNISFDFLSVKRHWLILNNHGKLAARDNRDSRLCSGNLTCEDAVWITILSASLNKSDIRRSIVLHIVECECIKHAVDIRVLRACRVLRYRGILTIARVALN